MRQHNSLRPPLAAIAAVGSERRPPHQQATIGRVRINFSLRYGLCYLEACGPITMEDECLHGSYPWDIPMRDSLVVPTTAALLLPLSSFATHGRDRQPPVGGSGTRVVIATRTSLESGSGGAAHSVNE
eukprot:GHVU01231468.1.p1 GENE.GHVU01231468.1~~GHVU01231468.1.p1  ORF type:complete len:128 (+),score=9.20 GHVU01231468.1:441-824(+)